MARRIPRREFLASLSAAAASTAGSSLSLARAVLPPKYFEAGATPEPGPIFRAKALKGVDFVLRNSPTPRKYLIETMPGGVALLDYNNDGLLDIFLVNGGHVRDIPGSPINFDRRNPAYWNRYTGRIRTAPSPTLPNTLVLRMPVTQTTEWGSRSGTTTMMAFPIFT